MTKRFGAREITVLALLTVAIVFAWPHSASRKPTGINSNINLPVVGVISVGAGGNFQTALNNAQPGDTILLEAGATFTGNFVLPVKGGSSYITVKSSRCAEVTAGQQITNAQESTLTAYVATATVAPVMRAPINSHHYNFECITFTQSASLPTDLSVGYAWSYNLIQLGDGASYESQTTLEVVPHHINFDRCIVRTRDAAAAAHRGITLNSANTNITNSIIRDIKWQGTETQAIAGWNGPGPYLIENNYLEAAGINILFGGASPTITNLIPSDIVIRGNTLTKKLAWLGQGLAVKNLFELKNARRVTFTDNTCQYSWPDGQTGWAVILNAFADAPWNLIDDVEISGNIFSDVSNGINLRGMESSDTVTRMHRINIHDNVIQNIGSFSGEGKAFQLLNGTDSVTINHNTVAGNVVTDLVLDSLAGYGIAPVKHAGLIFTNQLMAHGLYGIFGNGGTFGTVALNIHASGWTATKNAMYAKPADPAASLYPAGNYFPATLLATTGLLGLDGLPVGANPDATPPAPTPTPTPIPTPTPAPTPTPTPSNACKPNQLISSGCTCTVPPRKIVGPQQARRCK